MSQAADEIAAHAPIDTRIEIVTPENIAFHYELAGPARRAIAYLIDVALRAILMIVAAIALGLSGLAGVGAALILVFWLVLSWFYGGLFETFWNGQTPGKWLLGLRVLTSEGHPINALQAVLRNVLREVDSMPFVPLGEIPLGIPMYTLGLATMMLTDRFARWGDLACGTMVVIEHRTLFRGVIPVDGPRVKELAAALPANFRATPSLARALSVYLSRRRYFGVARRQEVARILAEPLAKRFNLPPGVDPDTLLCALYYHTFVAEDVAARRGGARAADSDPLGFLKQPVGPVVASDSLAGSSTPAGIGDPSL